jgi:hypothetical protein
MSSKFWVPISLFLLGLGPGAAQYGTALFQSTGTGTGTLSAIEN